MDNPFTRYFDEHLPEALAWFGQAAGESADDSAGGELLITKHATVIEIPEELLMDYGVIPDTRERKPVPWRTRLRWKLAYARETAAELAYRLIAGHDAPERDW